MAAGRKQPSAMPGNDSHPKVWPPSQPNHAQTQRVQQARGVVMENKRIHVSLGTGRPRHTECPRQQAILPPLPLCNLLLLATPPVQRPQCL